MAKYLIIIGLIGFLFYLFSRRFFMTSTAANELQNYNKRGFVLLNANARVISKIVKSTTLSVGIGAFLFIVILALAIKIKILLILLPISIYLISQFILLNNHIKYLKNQQIWYDKESNIVEVEYLRGERARFNLNNDAVQVKSVQAVQKNQGVLFGYYEIQTPQGLLFVPYLLEENKSNQFFFEDLKNHHNFIKKSTLYPLI